MNLELLSYDRFICSVKNPDDYSQNLILTLMKFSNLALAFESADKYNQLNCQFLLIASTIANKRFAATVEITMMLLTVVSESQNVTNVKEREPSLHLQK